MLGIITKESAKMTLSEYLKLSRERSAEILEAEQMLEDGVTKNQQLEAEAYYKEKVNALTEAAQAKAKRDAFSTNVKAALLNECLYKLYVDCAVAPLTESDKVIAKNLVKKFVNENGASQLLNTFKTKNIMLCEFSRIVEKYYNQILETTKEKEKECGGNAICTNFKVDTGIQDDFLKELQDIDTEDASELIRDRITDAITDFVDSNTLEKLEYEEIISSAQDKINATKSEAVVASINTATNRRINEMKMSRKRNILHSLVESLCSSAIKDSQLKEKYIHEGTVDMDSIVEDAQLIYTMLEMVNTTEMVPVNEEFLKAWIV